MDTCNPRHVAREMRRAADILDQGATPETSPAGKLHFDRWTNGYHDSFLNDAWVMRRYGRKQWEFATREYGNQTLLRGRFRNLVDALNAADAFLIERDGGN